LIYDRAIVSGGEVHYILQVARPLTERNHSLQLLSNTLVLASLLTLVVAFGIGWLFSGITLLPINRITQTTKTIGEERNFSKRVEYHGPQDEVGQLASTINSMLSRLQDAYQQVAHSLSQQRDFVADVSHELRTPLTTLRGNLGLLVRNPPIPAEEQKDIINDMVLESDRMIRLVNELLRLAHADAGRSLKQEQFSMTPIVEDCCRQIQSLDETRKISWVCPPELTICADKDAFRQVLLILLDNAMKHSTGKIEITVLPQKERVQVFVKDFGQGISQNKLERVFDRFYRADEETQANGFGLGLPIARSLVEGMGGSIRIDSQIGNGCTITLEFNR
jgi:two-component system, OmpR family, sensor kinase